MSRNKSEGTVGRRSVLKGAAALGATAAITGFPWVARAQAKVIRVGMPTILTGRVAILGETSQGGAKLEVEKFNAAGGVNGRTIELVVRDSKGRPDEAARIVRDLVNKDGCELIIDAEASSASFAVQEVMKELNVYCVHTCSETSSLTADPKLHAPTAFRAARQGIHDAVGGGDYAARVAKERGLTRWMSCSPDYAYGRDNTAEFMEYAAIFNPEIELVDQSWPKLFQPDYTEVITKILQVKPQALYSALWGGDLVAFIDQANIYGLFQQVETFAVNLGDYGVVGAVKGLPAGIHSGSRYSKIVPDTPANAEWFEEYRKVNPDHLPSNWSWENSVGASFLIEALKRTNGNTDGAKMAEATKDLKIKSPFGVDGTLTMRGSDHTVINYPVGFGISLEKEPYIRDVFLADWAKILEHEQEWKQRKGYA